MTDPAEAREPIPTEEAKKRESIMQNFEAMNAELQEKFAALKKERPDLGKRRLNFSSSN